MPATPSESTTSHGGALRSRYLLRLDACCGPLLPKPTHGPRPDGSAVDVALSRCASPGQLPLWPRPAVSVGPTAGGTVQRCAEQLLPGAALWPTVPHRGRRRRRCRAERTIEGRTCVAADGEAFSRASRVGPSQSQTSKARTPRRGRQYVLQHPGASGGLRERRKVRGLILRWYPSPQRPLTPPKKTNALALPRPTLPALRDQPCVSESVLGGSEGAL